MAYLGAGITRFNTADDLTVTGDAQIDTNTLVVDSTNNRVGILNASPATALDVTGTLTADDIVLSGGMSKTGDLTFDISGDIILDADDNGTIQLHDGGTYYGLLRKDNNNFQLYSIVQDGDMVFRGNDGGSNVTALTLDMSDAGTAIFNNKVGIGVTPFASTGYSLQIGGTSQSFISIHNNTTGNTVNDGFSLGNDASNVYLTNRENTPMIFSTNNTERMRILAGGGLTFNGDTAAANALDDYETGAISSTNILKAATTNPTISISANRSIYHKIGTFVRAHFDISFTVSSAGSGDLILNLPFTVDGIYNYNGVHAARANSAFTGIRDYEISGYGSSNSTNLYLLYSTGTAGAEAAISSSALATSGSVRICLDFNYRSQ